LTNIESKRIRQKTNRYSHDGFAVLNVQKRFRARRSNPHEEACSQENNGPFSSKNCYKVQNSCSQEEAFSESIGNNYEECQGNMQIKEDKIKMFVRRE